MAFERNHDGQFTKLAASDMTANQYRFVKVDPSNPAQFILPAAGGPVAGVLQNHPSATNAGTIVPEGVSKVIAGAAVAADAPIASDATGRAVTAVTDDHVVGRAELAATGAGLVISVRLGNEGILP